MTLSADLFFSEGCGRCPLGNTPLCTVHKWKNELELLRMIVLDCGLKEESKWGVPCYTFQNKNIVLLGSFKEYCSLSFFKGALLQDDHGLLVKPGENSQAARLLRFVDVQKVIEQEPFIREFVFAAIELEKSGAKVAFSKNSEPIPEELHQKMEEMPTFRAAFNALTPGRQRGYILHFSAPKQSKTRTARIEKYMEQIFKGKGLHD